MAIPTIPYPLISGIILMLGCVSLGLSLVYTSPTLDQLTSEFNLGKWEQIMINVCGTLGGTVSAPIMDFCIVKYLGRRYSTLLTSIVAILSFIGLSQSRVKWLLFLMRTLNGMTIGFYSTVIPVYLVEIAPPDKVGLFGYMAQIGISIGFILPTFFGMIAKWRIMTILSGIPSLILLCFILFIPQIQQNVVTTSCGMVLKYPKPLFIAFCLMFFLQFSGVNALLSNLEPIINKTKSKVDPSLVALIANITQIVSTVLASIAVDKFGRRMCWLVSTVGQIIAFIILTCQQLVKLEGWVFMVGLYLEQFTYGVGTGPIPFLLTAELFPVELRSTAMAVATSADWFLASAICFIWPLMDESFGLGYSFLFFAGISVLATVFGVICIKDVKKSSEDSSSSGKDPEDMTRRLSKHRETVDDVNSL